MLYRLFLSACLVLLMLISAPFVSFSADADLRIEFDYPAEAVPTTTEFRLYVEKSSGIKTLIATTQSVDGNVWDVSVTDIPMGRPLNYFMSAVDADGDEGISPPEEFKLIGRPVINAIRRVPQ